jgi:hypothetical protein
MALVLSDLVGRRIDILGRAPSFPLGATGATTVCVMLPAYNIGANKAVVMGLQFDTFSSTATVFTASAGQSGATTDWVGATAITPSSAGTLLLTTQTANTYGPNTSFQVNVTVAGTASTTCLVTVLGFFE